MPMSDRHAMAPKRSQSRCRYRRRSSMSVTAYTRTSCIVSAGQTGIFARRGGDWDRRLRRRRLLGLDVRIGWRHRELRQRLAFLLREIGLHHVLRDRRRNVAVLVVLAKYDA